MRNPVSRRMLAAILSVGYRWGWHGFSTLCWLMFHGLLRPEEGLALSFTEIWISDEIPVAVVNLGKTKTWKYGARRQHVLVDDVFLIQALRRLRREVPHGQKLFPYGHAAFAHRLRLIQRAIGVPELVTPGSFRPGGATLMWVTYRNFEAIRLRGRWGAPGKTLEHYLQECMVYFGEGQLDPTQAARVRTLASCCPALVSHWLHH